MEASWAISWMERLLKEGDQGGQQGRTCQDFEQDCKEAN
jgi:hypothetical protein